MKHKLVRQYRNILQQMQRVSIDDKGFSLVELMVVIVIMGLLTTVVVINVMPSNDRAMVDKARVDISRLDQAVEMFRMEMQRYPTTDEGVEVLTQGAGNGGLRREGIIKDLPKDPWGNAYQYLYPGEHGTYDIFSYGADGRLGGEDMNADIGNWKEK